MAVGPRVASVIRRSDLGCVGGGDLRRVSRQQRAAQLGEHRAVIPEGAGAGPAMLA